MYFKTTIFDKIPQLDLHKTLDLPLENFYEAFYTDMWQNQLHRVHKDMSKEELKELFEENYTRAEVKENLNEMVSEALNRFS